MAISQIRAYSEESPMFLRSTCSRLGIAVAAASLFALAGAGPALADEATVSGLDVAGSLEAGADFDTGIGRSIGFDDEFGFGFSGIDAGFVTRGRVDAPRGLALRSDPFRGGRLIRIARHGEPVGIFCRTNGEPVDGDTLWYLLADGTWSWAPARSIETFGVTPPWC
ncbi:SH3 domain-containing protein [Streptomyces krungchingensis]|uniref:SH3 domain-containing protein n=1 Tax=Streptomyces TaxID=1883 RepID=UPI003CF254D0